MHDADLVEMGNPRIVQIFVQSVDRLVRRHAEQIALGGDRRYAGEVHLNIPVPRRRLQHPRAPCSVRLLHIRAIRAGLEGAPGRFDLLPRIFRPGGRLVPDQVGHLCLGVDDAAEHTDDALLVRQLLHRTGQAHGQNFDGVADLQLVRLHSSLCSRLRGRAVGELLLPPRNLVTQP